jgi:hypothetical protein
VIIEVDGLAVEGTEEPVPVAGFLLGDTGSVEVRKGEGAVEDTAGLGDFLRRSFRTQFARRGYAILYLAMEATNVFGITGMKLEAVSCQMLLPGLTDKACRVPTLCSEIWRVAHEDG